MKRGIVTGLVLLASCLILILRPQKFSLLLSAYSSVLLAERGLSQCTSGLLLGGWQDSNFVPFPFNVLDVFLEEARGGLSEQKRAGLQFKGLNFGSILEAFPPLKDELAQGDGTLGFQPPCFYHFYSGDDIRRIFEGKWLYFLGDSNTRALVMGLLTLLDPTHQQPYDDKLWFNGTGGDEFPHLQYIEYFFRVDGSILAKSASGIRPPDDLPQEPYSIRISYRFKMEGRELLESLSDALGREEWQPDVLYFNTGGWDARAAKYLNRTWPEIDAAYGRLMDRIASTCRPERQVCFWATLTSNLYRNDTREHSRLALMQFRHAARMALRQADGAPKSLIFFDRFWPSHVSDQQRGVHFSHLVNIWDAQRLLNVYHGISSRHITEMEVDSEIDTPTKFSGNMAPQCVLTVDRHLARAACDWLPERVTFAKSCVLTEDDPGETGPVHMFKRNCTAEVEILHR